MVIQGSPRWRYAAHSGSRLLAYTLGRRQVFVAVHATSQDAPAAAWVNRATGQVQLVADRLGYAGGISPQTRPNLMLPTGRAEHPVLAGALLHEAAHLAHTRWLDTDSIDAAEAAAVAASRRLEEARIEGRWLQTRPMDRLLIRSAIAHVVLGSFDRAGDDQTVIGALELLLPRIDSGVFPAGQLTDVTGMVLARIGDHGLAEFAGIWRDVHSCADNDTDGMVGCGHRWAQALHRWFPDVSPNVDPGCDNDTDTDSTGGDSDDGAADIADCSAGEAPAGGDRESESDSSTDNGAENAASTPNTRTVARALTAIRDDTAAEAARTTPGTATYGRPGNTDGTPAMMKGRAPTADDRTFRAALTNRLRQAQIRQTVRTRARAPYPGGRMHGGQLVALAAQIAHGVPVTATPWQRTRFQVQNSPRLTVAIVADTSGSMQPWLGGVETISWALAHAAANLRGRCAAYGFGGFVQQTISPAAPPPAAIPVYEPTESSRGCAATLTMASRNLLLPSATGARLAIVITDSALPEQDDIQRAADTYHRHHIPILWMVTDTSPAWTPKRVLVSTGVTTDQFPKLVVTACERALRGAS